MLLLFSSVSWMMFTLTFFILQYEPELFPGLIYRMKQPKIVLLIFVSGKIVLTGAKVAVFFTVYTSIGYYFRTSERQ